MPDKPGPRKPRKAKAKPPPAIPPGPAPTPSTNGTAHPPAAPAEPAAQRSGMLMSMDRYVHRETDWLIPGIMPRGRLVLISGARDSGKSVFLSTVAAHVSGGDRGRWPGVDPMSGHVIVISPEEDAEGELLGRLGAAGADLSKVYNGDQPANHSTNKPLTYPDDHATLRQLVISTRAQLLVIDPITRRLSPGCPIREEATASSVLMPLVDLAHDTGVTICYSCHLRKDKSGDSLDWVLGAAGWTGIPRFALLMGKDPHDESKRVMAWSRCATQAKPPSRRFAVDGEPGCGVFRIGEPCGVKPDDMTGQCEELSVRDAMQEAKSYLKTMLDEGRRPADDLLYQARNCGVTERTLRRAKVQLGVTSHREMAGDKCCWFWQRPAEWPAEGT